MVKPLDFSRTCRLCSKVYRIEKLVKIFSNRGTSLNLKDSVNAHLPIKVIETDSKMPENVCMNCIRRLNASNEFFATVVASDKLFKRILKKKEIPKESDFLTTTTTMGIEKAKVLTLSIDVENESDNINTPKKFDLNLLNGDEADSKLVLSKENNFEDKSETDIVNNVALESWFKSENDNYKDATLNGSIETGENNLSNNSEDRGNVGNSKYVNIVPKSNHVVLGNRNCNGNILINIASNAIRAKDQAKLPIEVLCCPDCKETVKIFCIEERQLFFEYLKQHNCNKRAEPDDRTKLFGKYKEMYRTENAMREKKKRALETNDTTKSNVLQGRIWSDGDSPADPGPDPMLYENIFEDDVRLDDDFHWPMPKRVRRLHRCSSCDFVTKSALRLKSHQKLHRTSDKRQILHSTSCKHCHKRFETVKEAKKHERLAHVTLGAKNALCEYCGVIKSQKTLRDHVLKQHTVESEIEMQECDVCGKSFISPTSLYLHKKIHTIEKQHLCDLCGKAFKQRISMRRHYMLHFPRAPPKFKCNICDKRVTTRGSLRLHMMRHTGEKPQECPECHMVMRHGLKHHMRLHSDESPFKCVVCGTDFKRRDYVRRHMRKHLNETEHHRTFECKICNNVFDDIKNFLIHHQNIHCNEIFTQIKIFECKTCSMQFPDTLQHRDHEGICNGTESEAYGKVYVDKLQSCIMINHTKASDVDEHKDCPKYITSNRSYPCAYCDYDGTSKITVPEETREDITGQLLVRYSDSAKNQQSRFRFNEDLRRLRDQHVVHQHSDHVILSDDVMSLGTESSEYSYINIIDKQELSEKDILMSVDEQIMTNSSVHVFQSSIEQFGQSLDSESQLDMHPHGQSSQNDMSWKEI